MIASKVKKKVSLPNTSYHPTCPKCFKKFAVRVVVPENQPRNASVPLLLRCGHAMCVLCVCQSYHENRVVLCPVCQVPTQAKADQLPWNVYVVGLLVEKQKAAVSTSVDFNVKMVPTKRLASVCSVCDQEASVKCPSCSDAQFCNGCFAEHHRQPAFLMHRSRPIGHVAVAAAAKFSLPLMCDSHPLKLIEYYCRDHDVGICADCVVVGDHKNHANVLIADRRKEVADNMVEAVERMRKVAKCLKYSARYLAATVEQAAASQDKCVQDIRNYFQLIHGILQMRESDLIATVNENASKTRKSLEEKLDGVLASRERVKSVIAEATFGGSSNIDGLLGSILECGDLPGFVEVTDEDCKRLVVRFTPSLSDSMVVRNVAVDALELSSDKTSLRRFRNATDVHLSGVSDDEEQEIEEADDDDDDDDAIPDLQPLETYVPERRPASGAFAIHSRSHQRPAKKTWSRPYVRPGIAAGLPRAFSRSTQEMVRVSYIVSPHHFYVRRKCEDASYTALFRSVEDFVCGVDLDSRHPKTAAIRRNDVYLVRYQRRWMRCRVVDVLQARESSPVGDVQPSRPTFRVHFLDDGMFGTVDADSLITIPPELLAPLPAALRCSLWRVRPRGEHKGEWSKGALDAFRDFVMKKIIAMTVMEEEPTDVLMVDVGGSGHWESSTPYSVITALVFLGYAYSLFPDGTVSQALPQRPGVVKTFHSPTMPLVGESFAAAVSHAASPLSFYVQNVVYHEPLMLLAASLGKAYSGNKGGHCGILNPIEGMACVALFEDGNWYRARIIGVPGSRTLRVCYVDYGNETELPYTDVKDIASKFLKMPEVAVHCALADVLPLGGGDEWPNNATRRFIDMVAEQQVTFTLEGRTDEALLVSGAIGNVSISSELVCQGLAISTGPCSQVYCETAVSSVATVGAKGGGEQPQQQKRPPRNAKGETELQTPVRVTLIESPSCIYIHMEHHQKRLHQLMENLRSSCESTEPPPPGVEEAKTWAAGDMCAVRSPHDGVWYRAVVVTPPDEVFCVDFGRTVRASALRPLPSKFTTMPPLAERCHLGGIMAPGGTVDKWPTVAIEFLQEIVARHDRLFVRKLDEAQAESNLSVPVQLFFEDVTVGGALEPMVTTHYSLSEMLLQQGLALPSKSRKLPEVSSKSSEVEEVDANEEKVVAAEEKEEEEEKCSESTPQDVRCWKPPVVPLVAGYRFEAIATNVTQDGDIFLHDVANGARMLETIKHALQSKYAGSEQRTCDLYWLPGEPCIAQFAMDKNWYRAQVLDVLPDGCIKVSFVDYGNEELVKPEELRKDVSFLEYEQQGFACRLFNIEPVNEDGRWPVAILNFMHTSVADKNCFVTIEVPCVVPPEVTLEFVDGSSMNDLLVNMKCARRLNKKSLAAPVEGTTCLKFPELDVPAVGSVLSVKVTEMAPSQPFVFHVQGAGQNERDRSTLEQYKRIMAQSACKWNFVVPSLGLPCCAQSTANNVWQRAVITDIKTDVQLFEVLYVDQGSQEYLTADRIRSIPAYLFSLSKQAFKCHMPQVAPVNDWTEGLLLSMREILFGTQDLHIEIKDVGSPAPVDLFTWADAEQQTRRFVFQDLVDANFIKLVRLKTWMESA